MGLLMPLALGWSEVFFGFFLFLFVRLFDFGCFLLWFRLVLPALFLVYWLILQVSSFRRPLSGTLP